MSANSSLSFITLNGREFSAGKSATNAGGFSVSQFAHVPGKEFSDAADDLKAVVSADGTVIAQASMPLYLAVPKGAELQSEGALKALLSKASGIDAGDLKVALIDKVNGLPLHGGGDAKNAIGVCVSQKAIALRNEQLATLGVSKAILVARSLSVIGGLKKRLQAGQIDQPVLYLDVQGDSTQLYIASSDDLADLGAVDTGADAILDQVMAVLGLKFPGSAAKLFYGDVYDFDDHAKKLIDVLAEKARGRLGSFKGKVPGPGYVYASGVPSSRYQLLVAALSEPLGLQPVPLSVDMSTAGASVPPYMAHASLGLIHMLETGASAKSPFIVDVNKAEESFKSVAAPAAAAAPTPPPVAVKPPPAPAPAPAAKPAAPAPQQQPAQGNRKDKDKGRVRGPIRKGAEAAPTPAAPAPAAKAAAPTPTPAPAVERKEVAKAPAPAPAKSGPNKAVLGGIAAAVLLVVILLFVFMGGGDDEPKVLNKPVSEASDTQVAAEKPVVLQPPSKPEAPVAEAQPKPAAKPAAAAQPAAGAQTQAGTTSGTESTMASTPQAEPEPEVEPELPPAPPAVGNIWVQSIPDGAFVYLNKELRGRTPIYLTDLLEGDYEVELRKEGFETVKKVTQVQKEETSRLTDLVMKVLTGSLNISTNVPGINYIIEPLSDKAGLKNPLALRGTTPIKIDGVEEGQYRIRFQRPQWPEYTREVEIRAGEEEALAFEYKPARVKVDTVPAGSTVTYRGEVLGTTPLVIDDLPEGEVSVYISKDSFEAEMVSVEVPFGEEVEIKHELLSLDRIILRPEELDVLPALTGSPEITIPPGLLGGAEGTVYVRLQIGKDGSVEDVKVTRSDVPRVNDIVLRAIRQWKFTPARRKGHPMRVVVAMPVSFKSERETPASNP